MGEGALEGVEEEQAATPRSTDAVSKMSRCRLFKRISFGGLSRFSLQEHQLGVQKATTRRNMPGVRVAQHLAERGLELRSLETRCA